MTHLVLSSSATWTSFLPFQDPSPLTLLLGKVKNIIELSKENGVKQESSDLNLKDKKLVNVNNL